MKISLITAAFCLLCICLCPILILAQEGEPETKEESKSDNDSYIFVKKVKPSYLVKKNFVFEYKLSSEIEDCKLNKFTVTVTSNPGDYETKGVYRITPYKCVPNSFDRQYPFIWCKKYKLIEGEDILRKAAKGTPYNTLRKRKTKLAITGPHGVLLVYSKKGKNIKF